VQIAPAEVHAIWKRLKASNPNEFSRVPSSRIGWHRQFGQTSESRKDYPAALFHVNQLIQLTPGDTSLIARRARIQALLQTNQPSGKK